MTLDPLAVALAGVSSVALAYTWRDAARTWSPLDRAGALVAVPGLVTFWELALRAVAGAPLIDWNGARLAPTFALARGYAPYYPATSGPILSTVYGPLAPLEFLPALLARTPTGALLCAGAINVAFVVVPLLVFLWTVRPRHPAGSLLALVGWLGACALMGRQRPSHYWLTMVHCDPPALAFGLLACAMLWPGDPDGPLPRPRLTGAALLAALSCFTKQVSAPLLVALGLFVWAVHGPRALRHYLVALAAAVGLLLVGTAVSWGVEAPAFNMFTILARQAWLRPGLGGLWQTALLLLPSAWESLAVLALGAGVGLWTARGTRRGWRDWVRHQPWLLPILPALLLLPTGVLAAAKLGGEQNSFYSLYFLIASAAAALAWQGGTLPSAVWRRIVRGLCYAYCALSIVRAWTGSGALWGPLPSPSANANQQAYAFMRRHPGEAYFPWYPLASLMAEGRLYHFEYGVFDRFLAGFEPTRAHLLAHVPPDMRMLVAKNRAWLLRYFPDYTAGPPSDELPGWETFSPPR